MSFQDPIEEQYTEWYNPLDVQQHVDVRQGDSPRPTRYRVPPKGSTLIPSRYDSVVHRVHNGVIIGGQAPQLVKRGSTDKLDDALNTELDKKRRADAEIHRQALAKQVAEDAAAKATAESAAAEKALRSREPAQPRGSRTTMHPGPVAKEEAPKSPPESAGRPSPALPPDLAEKKG